MEDALNFAILRSWFVRGAYWEKAAYALWFAVLAFVSVRVFIAPEHKTVYTIFSSSARLWLESGELYDPHRPKDVRDGYRYNPSVTALFTPFALLPDRVGGIVWRFVNALAMFLALAWLARSVFSESLSSKHYAWLLLLIAPLALQSVSNGQTNPLVVAAMIGAVAAVKEERWNLASGLIALAFVFKIYPLALGMVLVVLYPRQLSSRLPIAAVASLLAAFLFQSPEYVIDQYEKWFALVMAEDRSATALDHMYRDLWLLIHNYGLPISRSMYLGMQLVGGAAVALLCWQRQRAGWPTQALLASTLALATAWMMLLGPATESSSFILLAPSLAWSVVQALDAPTPDWRRCLLWGSCAGFLAAVILGGFRGTLFLHALGVHPWACVLYGAYLLTESKPVVAVAAESVFESRMAA
jgi:hypothetical protein